MASRPSGLVPVRRAVLIVLDGWGIAPDGPGNAIARAHTPSFYRGLPEIIYLDEVASNTIARLASFGVIAAGLVAIALVTRRTTRSAPE